MKTIIKNIVVAFCFLSICQSCEKVLNYSGDDTSQKISINALANTDTVFTISLYKTMFFADATFIDPAIIDRIKGIVPGDDSQVITDNAEVKITVNSSDEYPLVFNKQNGRYESSYTPVQGDNIKIEADVPNLKHASATIQVPTSVAYDIVNYRQQYDKHFFIDKDGYSDLLCADTTMTITLRIHDPNGKNYYRLKVRSIAKKESAIGDADYYYNTTDRFVSSDIIFKDERLIKSYATIPAYFSDVFDDSVFDGKDYDFTVDSRMRQGDNPYISIQLQTISKELYNYIKSIELYRITDRDSYTEAIMIYSNIIDGYGIFGGLSGEHKVINFTK